MSAPKTLIAALSGLCIFALAGSALAFDHPHVYRADDKGNSDIKAGYSMYAGFMRCSPDDPLEPGLPMVCFMGDVDEQYMKLEARSNAWVKLFGQREDIAYAQAMAEDHDGFTTTRVRLKALGMVLYEDDRDGISVTRGIAFGESKKFGMSGIKVKVQGAAGAEVGVTFNGGPVGKDIALYVTPFGDAGVSASASVGASCASASVEGSLSAIDIEVPAVLWVSLEDDITVDLDIDRRHRLMDGKIKAKLNYCLGNASKTIVERDSSWSTAGLLDRRYTF